MAGYISEGIRYFRLAREHCDLVEASSPNALVSIVFSAMYIESVANEVIFREKLWSRLYEEHFGKKEIRSIEMDIDIYNERKSFLDKLHIILGYYHVEEYEHDPEFIELSHLMTIRGFLAHLKPVEQIPSGEPKLKLCRAALNYLHRNLKIIGDPYAKGVYWTDVVMTRKVADWAVKTVVDGVNWLFDKTHDGRLGNLALSWHRQLTR